MRIQRISTILLALFTVILFSCKKEDSRYIEETAPNERTKVFIDDLRETLITSDNGWVDYLYTSLRSGYTFYFDFIDENRVKMLGDFNNETLTDFKESSYSIQNTWTPSLIFDTYNHIHILSDPDKSKNDGDRGEGLYADFEFSIQKIYPDSIVLSGNLNNNKMVLMRASKEEADSFKDQSFAGLTNRVEDYVISNPFLYLTEEGSQSPASFTFNFSDRYLTFSYKENGELEEKRIALAVGKNTMWLQDVFEHEGKSISALKLVNDQKMVAIQEDGTEYDIRIGNNPIESLYERLHSQRYNFIQILERNQVGAFAGIYDRMHQNVQNNGRSINYIELRIKSADTLTMNYRYRSSKDFNAFHDYRMVVEGDELRFEHLPLGGSSGAYSNYTSFTRAVTEFDAFLTSNTFDLDYYTGIVNGAIQTLPRLRSQSKPDSFILLNIE